MRISFSFITLFFLTSAIGQSSFESFVDQTGAEVTWNRTVDNPNFIRLPLGQSLGLDGNDKEEKMNVFLDIAKEVYPIGEGMTLKTSRTRTDPHGGVHVRKQQYYFDVPVFDCHLNFHFDQEEKLTAVNGNYFPEIKLSTAPSYSKTWAEERAIAIIDGKGKSDTPTFVRKSTLFIFNPGLIKGHQGEANYLVYEVEVTNDVNVRDYLYVDAQTGNLIEHYPGICEALDRRLYENNTSTLTWEEGDPFPGALDMWQQNEVTVSGHAYYLHENAFGWTSYDNADARMRTVNNAPISCPNASWNGSTANYCTGTASDDVIGHEWGHAYTEYSCGLIYAWQSGALNESFSDIWGETIDLLNLYEDAGEDLSLRTGCSSSDRWRMGEDASAFGGAIRDMWDPTCDNDPGKVSDNEYHCSTSDNGGVHSNSGVPNHMYALLVDGGTYNGQTITGIGFTKAAHLIWQAQSMYLGRTSDFAACAMALQSSCNDLITAGTDLEGLSFTSTPAGPSGEIMNASDLTELDKALLAVEMINEPVQCSFEKMLKDVDSMCVSTGTNASYHLQDWENGLGAWTVSQIPNNPATWDSRDWEIESNLPEGRTGQGIFGVNPIYGNCSDDLDNGIIRLESPVINIAAGAAKPVLMTFDHYVSLENTWDGGNVKYSLNSGPWTIIPSAAFVGNPYNGSLRTAGQGNDNPMAGEPAFTGSDEGSVSGTWGQSQVNLTCLNVNENDNIQFRWELGTDGCNGWDGWYLDDVAVFSCRDTTIWNGTGLWTDEANWSNGIPNLAKVAIVNSGTVNVTTNQAGVFYAVKVVVGSGAVLYINIDAVLELKYSDDVGIENNGTISNSGTIKSIIGD